MKKSELKPIAQYALNDVVWARQWNASSGDVSYSVRFSGVSPEGSICFRIRRQTFTTFGGSAGILNMPAISMPTLPEAWDVQLPLSADGIATAPWRMGPGSTDVEFQHYYVTSNNVLTQVELLESESENAGKRTNRLSERR